MPNVSADENSQVCVVGSTHTLYSETDEGNYTLTLDFNTAAAGDWFEVSVETNVLSGGTLRTTSETIEFIGVQTGKIWKSDPYDVVYGITFKLTQKAGTARTIPWAVTELG